MISRRVGRCFACVAAVAIGPGGAAWAQQPMPSVQLDAATCAALSASPARTGAKFSLGRQACADVPVAPPRPLPPTQQAQQLYLYGAGVPSAGPPAPAPAAASAVLPTPRPPARTSAPRPSPKPVSKSLARAVSLAPMVDEVAHANAIDPLLLHAIAYVESRHDPRALSHAGARGMMQVMPATASRFGVGDAEALWHAPTNLQVSAAYLKTLHRRFGGDLQLVLAAYNAGEGAVERHGRRIPPYAETRAYVRKVTAEYAKLVDAARALAAGAAALPAVAPAAVHAR